MIISIFKTSIKENDLEKLKTVLFNINEIKNWNTDLEDCDNILRVESIKDITAEIIKLTAKEGIEIKAL